MLFLQTKGEIMKNIFEINDCPLFSGLKEYDTLAI